ncbi:MAG: hypothetical protein WBW14_19510, partial [Candidatus Acidiferrum sp.]
RDGRWLEMKETAQEYVQRIRSKIAGQNPLKVQSATARKLERLIKGAAPAKLRKRPAPEKWSAAEILAELRHGIGMQNFSAETRITNPAPTTAALENSDVV